MTPQQQATLTAALAGRVAVWLLVYPDGTTGVVLDRARAEAAALKGAVWVEMGPMGKKLDTEAQIEHSAPAKPLTPQRESGLCG